jgi:hypothetical protein
MKTRATVLALTMAAVLAAIAPLSATAGTTQYNPRRAGHPVRIIAYALHPLGVLLDYAIFRPAWWVGTHEPLRTIFGVQIVVDDSARSPARCSRTSTSPSRSRRPRLRPRTTRRARFRPPRTSPVRTSRGRTSQVRGMLLASRGALRRRA